jgi:hypothetical protein
MTGPQLHCRCGKEIRVRPDDLNRRIKCTACGHIIEPTSSLPTTLSANRAMIGLGALTCLIGVVALLGEQQKPDLPNTSSGAPAVASPITFSSLRDSLAHEAISCAKLIEYGRVTPVANGKEITRGIHQGLGRIKIDNGSGLDAVAALRQPSGRDIRRIYITAGSTARIAAIPSGEYELIFSVGRYWVQEIGDFCENRSHSRFDETFAFTETYERGATQYSEWEVTLHRVTGGNADIDVIDEADFAAKN